MLLENVMAKLLKSEEITPLKVSEYQFEAISSLILRGNVFNSSFKLIFKFTILLLLRYSSWTRIST